MNVIKVKINVVAEKQIPKNKKINMGEIEPFDYL